MLLQASTPSTSWQPESTLSQRCACAPTSASTLLQLGRDTGQVDAKAYLSNSVDAGCQLLEGVLACSSIRVSSRQ